MWGLFQVINVVVLLNVCVALMNNTMIIINEEQCSTILTSSSKYLERTQCSAFAKIFTDGLFGLN